MLRRTKRFSRPGTAPGTLEAPAERRVEEVRMSVMSYGPDHLDEGPLASLEEVPAYRDRGGVTWVNIVGLHDVGLLRRLGDAFDLHSLALEDVLNTGQRPKLEEYDGHQFLIMRRMFLGRKLESEQVSIFFGPGWVITLQEVPEDCFDPVRERIRGGRGRIRNAGADYLAYALVDALVDQLFPLLEDYGERIEALELELMEEPTEETLGTIHAIKRDLLELRRAAWPQREVVSNLGRLEAPAIHADTKVYLRDCYDHTVHILDLLETYRDLTSSMLDVYLSSVSNRMNEVMKVLTVIASIFIPLTFIAGVYGMNFNPHASPWNMPELDARYGYPALWGVMVATAVGLFLYFRRKGWL